MKSRLLSLTVLCLCLLSFHAAATTYYVDVNSTNPTPPYTSWSTASTDIQSAVNQTTNGDLILVNPGVYGSAGYTSPDGALTAVLVTNAITLQSISGAQSTSITGSNAIRCVDLAAAGATLNGFAFAYGHVDFTGVNGTGYGGGVKCAAANDFLFNCLLTGNYSGWSGADSGGTLSNCILVANSSGWGGAAGQSTLINCVLTNNYADYWGGAAYQSSLTNCLIVGNGADNSAGGVAACTINNCTIVQNYAYNGPGGIDGSTAAFNSIIYYNTGSGPSQNYLEGMTLNNCCTIPAPAGTGNITDAPLFVNVTNDFHLESHSPCINLGDNNCVALSSDLDEKPRIVDGDVDMGAYEYQFSVPLTATIQVDNTNVATGFPFQLQAVVRGGIADFISWDFGDGTAATNQSSVSHAWSSPGLYAVTLLVSNEYEPGTAGATLAVNVGTPPMCYVNADGTDPVPPFLSWGTAATNIQDAINATYDGGTVSVTNGVYQFGGETVNGDNLTNRIAITKPIAVQSVNGPVATIIQGNPSLNNDAVRCAYMVGGATLNGFTLMNGSTLNSGYSEQVCGGGIFCESSNATILNCILATNSAGYAGGGIFQGSLSNCVINNNSSGNSAGGAINCAIANSIFENNSASQNGGAADLCTVCDCTLTNNAVGTSGGGAYQSDLTNCLIICNSAGQSGGGVNGCTVNNCTIVNNQAGQDGGVDGSTAAYNCIIYYNVGSEYNSYQNYQAGMTLNYCCTTPTPGGTGNITNAPSFVNVTNDFHLQSNSPCIDVGNNAYVALATDLDGNTRVVQGTVDMGAYEYQILIPLSLTINEEYTNIASGFPLALQAVVGQGSASSIIWNFGDGTIVTNQFVVSHVWSSQGTYTVTVTVSNNSGPQPTTATLTVNVVASPVSYVNANGTNPIAPYFSWETAATNIQDAVDAAYAGGMVLVTNGTYSTGGETVNGSALTNRVVINKPITVQSVNGPGNTFILGEQIPGPQIIYQYDAMRCVYMTNGATLAGFTLANGGTLSNGNDDNGGGVWCASTNNDVISNCVITANAAYYQGGGAYQGTLMNCTVLGNQAASGGGIANALVFQSLVISNRASLRGTSDGGGAYDCIVFSSAFTENSSSYEGGGAYGGTLVNCTITENSAEYAGGGTANCVPTNCIIYYNKIFSGNTAYTNHLGVPIYYCCTTPKSLYPGNITNEPVLASISHISLNSPCRGAGEPIPAEASDIDGNSWNDPPSIGCSEIPSGGDYGNLAVSISVPFTNQAPGYPLNFQATISGPIYTTVWNFGDGTIVTNAATISHTWSSVGNYPVTLTAYNDSYPTGITATQMITVAVPSIYYVDLNEQNPTPPYSHWSTAATNIQDAVNLAPPGSLVLVTNQYVLVNLLDAGYITNYVAVYQYGGMSIQGRPYRVGITNPITVQSVNGPSVTYISAFDSTSSDNGVYLTNGAILIGFTVTNNIETGTEGIFATSTNALITNCIVTQFGGAASSGTFDSCAFIGNSSPYSYGGATLLSVLNNCLVSNNTAEYGGGVCGGILNNCVVVSNTATYGGGAYSGSGYPLALNGCIVSNNTAEYGGGVYEQPFNGPPSVLPELCFLSNCIVTMNSASQAGGGAVSAEMNNCVVSSNRAQEYGGGVEDGLLNNCTLIGNNATAGGGADGFYFGGNIHILNNCTLTGNFGSGSYGGGGGASGFTLNQCLISRNVATNNGGGVTLCILNNCLVISNTAFAYSPIEPGNGGGAYYSTLTNCILAYNVSHTNGGGAFQSMLVNCTVIANSASLGGGAMDCTNYNCILYQNEGGDFYPNTTQYPLIYCCASLPATNGFRNITNAPLFVDLAAGDYHLQPTSPCINSGNNAYVANATDLDGNSRIVGGTVDIGAYEYQTPTSVISYAYLQQYGLPTDGSEDFKDLDGTAFNVYQDWIAGLNPTNSASVLAMLTPIVANTASGVTVTWQSVSGIPYFLQRSTNLLSQPPFSIIQSNITGQANTNTTSYTDTSATNNVPYFYRVGVVAP